ncbi:hypothetical protein [Flavobacterium cerinum]|uniref:RING-type E3 ubiquitin transferase n=1 Tax=Flavobacterium cerinum TaxID=2502784 RepID=A0A3S3Q7E6_9FLAO|nr:hypothetical protein [Flavobacterium cerinum]RWW91673.1 hypothetical protein EPI11_18475 [Flavobacterium cerinum]
MSIKEKTTVYLESKPKLKKFIGWIVSFVFMILFFVLNFRLLYIIPAVIFIAALLPSRRKAFYKMQALLPTSKMNAIAMGIVEVEGEVEEIEPLISPYFSNSCVGYLYTIEEERKDDEGKRTWHTIHSESKTGTFKMNDETGSVTIDGEGLEYYTLNEDQQVESGSKRHTESYLKSRDYMLLIGYASSDNGATLIKKDDHYKVFGIAAPGEISIRNKYQPLLKSFLVTLFFLALIIVFIILN